MLLDPPCSHLPDRSTQPEQPSQFPKCLNKCDFRLASFAFRLRLSNAVVLPPFKGALFHGALGCALERIGTGFRDYFYHPRPPQRWQYLGQAPPRPYALIPPLDERTHYRAGNSLELGVILYGDAVEYFMVVFAALQHLGESMGLGKNQARFAIEEVLQLGLNAPYMLYRHGHLCAEPRALGAEAFFNTAFPATDRIILKHTTRLRLKADNQLLRTPPPFSLLLDRLLGRINTLAAMYCGGILIAPDEKRRLHSLAETVRTERSTLQCYDWRRFSQRSGETMPFGGLLGETVYCGELAPFMPWLNLGQWTGVGGKTSFGLGFYRLLANQLPRSTTSTNTLPANERKVL